jgi:hypothetical protein
MTAHAELVICEQSIEASIQLNYTTVLNIVFLILAAVLVWRFPRTGGPRMLKEM